MHGKGRRMDMEQQVQMTFEEKLQKLAELAKTKKNVLENREILDFFRGEILDPEKLDRIYDFLDSQHVEMCIRDRDTISCWARPSSALGISFLYTCWNSHDRRPCS